MQDKILQIRPQVVGTRRFNGIDPFPRQLHDRIADLNKVGIVTQAAGEDVRGSIPPHHVVEIIANPIDGPITNQCEIFKIRAESPPNFTLYRINPFSSQLDHCVSRTDHIGVIALTAG